MYKLLKTLIILLFILFNTLSAQVSKTDSLITLIPTLDEDSLKVNLLNEISYGLFSADANKAIVYGLQAEELAGKIKYPKGQAYALKNIGLGYYMQGMYHQVLDYWNRSLAVFESVNNLLGVANLLNNLGSIYYHQGDDATALDYYLKSLAASEKLGNELRIATALINIGAVYNNKKATHDKALEYYLRAYPYGEKLEDEGIIGTTSLNIGDLYLEQDKDSLALIYYEKSRKVWHESVRLANSLTNIGTVYSRMGEFSKAIEYQTRAINLARDRNAKFELIQSLMGLAETYQLMGNAQMALKVYEEAKTMALGLKASYELQEIYEGMVKLYAGRRDFNNAFRYQTLLLELKDTLFNIETDDKIKGLQFTYEIDKKQSEINLLTKDKEIQQVTIQKQRVAKNAFLAGLLLIFVIAFIIFRNYMAKVKINKILDNQKAEIENLLLNILPKKIAKELRLNGKANPRSYESVTVLFTDFKDFTKISEELTPEELVNELNDYFVAFDNITEKYNLEKIKTIGDAYMCAGGLPERNNTHPFDAILAALEMQEHMNVVNTHRTKIGKKAWGLRVGIHTGPIMAGVVGRKKYAYDIWGNTVNVASRMESNGKEGKVNISADTFEIIKDKFECTNRGKIYAKNVGEIDMHFVDKAITRN